MMEKIRLYLWTVRYMKPSQVFWRVAKRLGFPCALKGTAPCRAEVRGELYSLPELDFDPAFLGRFSVEELMADQVTFLYEKESICWEGTWQAENRSPLWNFNLHYFEYLHPLTARYLETGDKRYLEKTLQMILGWIRQNSAAGRGTGWASYPISLRLTNWLAWLAAVGEELEAMTRQEVENSLFEQYAHLSAHLEKDILGNHYFENLKALVLCALYFGDEKGLAQYLSAFRKECREEILPDGMHFELSPMYHKIVLEGLLRVTSVLRKARRPDVRLEQLAQDMLDAAFALEQGLHRTPLFNDSGDNVAKSLEGLLAAAKNHLGLSPVRKEALAGAGYYFFENGPWRLIVDAGAPGPDYIPGHSHCDAMSFELFRDGAPILVNCGTYAYQWARRSRFRSTRCHNTVQIADIEQSEIWSTFRLGRRSRTKVLEVLPHGIRMEMTDYQGNRIRREIMLEEDRLTVKDCSAGHTLRSYLHSTEEMAIHSSARTEREDGSYAPEYGLLQTIQEITFTAADSLELSVKLT